MAYDISDIFEVMAVVAVFLTGFFLPEITGHPDMADKFVAWW